MTRTRVADTITGNGLACGRRGSQKRSAETVNRPGDEPSVGSAEQGMRPPVVVGTKIDLGASSGRGGDGVDFQDGHEQHRDPITAQLALLSMVFEDVQKTRLACENRARAAQESQSAIVAQVALDAVDSLQKIEGQVSRRLQAMLRKHVLWSWLEQFPGLAGPRTARLLAIIGDPHRFPGQQCTHGHTLPPDYPTGAPCPVTSRDGEPCPGTMLPPRTKDGRSSLQHYLGLHVVNGRSPRKQKGVQCTWHPKGRALVLGPHGIADQIVLHRPEPYRSICDQEKERLARERGVHLGGNDVEAAPRASHGGDELGRGNGASCVPPQDMRGVQAIGDGASGAPQDGNGAEADLAAVAGAPPGLRPFQVHNLAKLIAAKRFLGDMLVEWKRRVGSDRGNGNATRRGARPT